MLDFLLAFSLIGDKYNAFMSMTCKFLKKVTLIEGKDILTAEKYAYIFLARLDLVDWGLLREVITNCNPKFFSKFWTALFEKLRVKLFYSIAYYLQTNGSSKKTNQTVKIGLRFFIYALNNSGLWSQVLSQIQAIINNTSSFLIGKTSNKVAYGFFPRRFFDLPAALLILDTLAACADVAEAVSFALINQKVTYKQKY